MATQKSIPELVARFKHGNGLRKVLEKNRFRLYEQVHVVPPRYPRMDMIMRAHELTAFAYVL